MKKRILVTGTNGRIGGMLMQGLREAGYDVVATARNSDAERNIEAMNLLDNDSVLRLTKGVDVIVHMAAYIISDQFEEKILPNNVIGTYNLYEAMRINGVKRMVFGSTNHVIGYYRKDEKITADSPYRPDSIYGLGKCCGELLGRLYADKYGISCINVRIGTYKPDNEPRTLRQTQTWVSCEDMLELAKCCIEAPESIKFLNAFGVSGNDGCFWPIEDLKELIGYVPKSNGAVFREKILKDLSERDYDDCEYMGGDKAFFP